MITNRKGLARFAKVCLALLSVCVCLWPSVTAKAQQFTEPEMVFVAGGAFTMGCTSEQGSDCYDNEKPSHEVRLSGFAIGRYEVTQALWQNVMGYNPSQFQGDNLPVENVSWDEVQIFLQRLNTLTGKHYRLPTEAEWEYAARGGQLSLQTPYAGGSGIADVSWYADNSGDVTHAVGTRQPNELGIYDMSGNVWEWCSDSYGQYSNKRQTNPKGAASGDYRIVKGGGYTSSGTQCRVSSRKSFYQGGKDNMTGFRLAMDDDRKAHSTKTKQMTEQERIAAEQASKKAAADDLKKEGEILEAAAKAAAREERMARWNERFGDLPFSTFFTLNAAYTSMPQWSYGFKVGTVQVFGWYFSAMTNFNYKGAFTAFSSDGPYTLTGVSKTTYLGAQAGFVFRPCIPVSLHLGAGFGYRTLNFETEQGWYNLPKRTYYGPTASLGVMFHLWGFVLSAEATGMLYNCNPDNSAKFAGGVRIGAGFCLPDRKKDVNY